MGIQNTRFVSLWPGVERQRFDAAASMIAITPDWFENMAQILFLRLGEVQLVRRNVILPLVAASALCKLVEHAMQRPN